MLSWSPMLPKVEAYDENMHIICMRDDPRELEGETKKKRKEKK